MKIGIRILGAASVDEAVEEMYGAGYDADEIARRLRLRNRGEVVDILKRRKDPRRPMFVGVQVLADLESEAAWVDKCLGKAYADQYRKDPASRKGIIERLRWQRYRETSLFPK